MIIFPSEYDQFYIPEIRRTDTSAWLLVITLAVRSDGNSEAIAILVVPPSIEDGLAGFNELLCFEADHFFFLLQVMAPVLEGKRVPGA